jgi:hypothetical protein
LLCLARRHAVGPIGGHLAGDLYLLLDVGECGVVHAIERLSVPLIVLG